jgi:hypothetical protein
MKKKSRTYYKRKADALLSKQVRARGACEMCGKETNTLQCAHVITRANLHLRYDMKNVLCLCAGCHLLWHREPLWAIGWFKGVYPERAKYLLKERYNIVKPDYEEIIKKLNDYK